MQSRVSSFVLIVLALIVFLGLGPITRIISDWWWFQTVGYDLTFLKILGVKTAAGVGIGLLAFLMVMTSTRYALSVIHTAPAVIDFQENPLGAMLARTSPQLISVGLGALADIARLSPIPVLAVGGVTPERVGACRAAGASHRRQ